MSNVTYTNSEKFRRQTSERVRAKRYGLTVEQVDTQLERQHGQCLICRKPLRMYGSGIQKTYNIDHDVKTGVLRGILCGLCNSALGFFREDPIALQNAIDYLKQVTHFDAVYKVPNSSEK